MQKSRKLLLFSVMQRFLAENEQAKLVIKAKNLAIQTIGKDISQKEETIGQLNQKLIEVRNHYELIRKI